MANESPADKVGRLLADVEKRAAYLKGLKGGKSVQWEDLVGELELLAAALKEAAIAAGWWRST